MIAQTLFKVLTKTKTIGFAGIVTAVAAWSIWGGDMFPAETDPTGGTSCFPVSELSYAPLKLFLDPSKWTDSELKRWLEVVRVFFTSLKN